MSGSRGKRSQVGKVIDAFNERILSGELASGERLPVEDELSRMLDVSRTPLREGVKVLEAVGVLEVRRGVGTFVTENARSALIQFSLFKQRAAGASLREMVETRFMLERTAAELAARNRTDENILLIRAANQHLRTLAQSGDASLDELTDADVAFHEAIFNACGNSLIATLGSFITEMFRPLIRESLGRAGGEAAAKVHDPVLVMIELGNAGGARESWTAEAVAEGLEHWQKSLEDENDGERTGPADPLWRNT